MNDLEVSVVIPAHNAAETIGRQLEALTSQLQPPIFEVILVANRCTDATVEIASRYASKLRLRLVQADKIASAAYARNEGAKMARSKFLLFCDADDVVGPGWIRGMSDPLVSGSADFVGGLLRVDRSLIPSWIYSWRYAFFDGKCIRNRKPLPYAISASLGVSFVAFKSVGGFDTGFLGAGSEEVDLCWRLLRNGYRLGAAPEAELNYQPRRTLRQNLAASRTYARGSVRLSAKEGNLGDFPSVIAFLVQPIKTVLYALLREHDLHPLSIFAKVHNRIVQISEHRRWVKTYGVKSQKAQVAFDCFADPTVPILGGLAFSIERSRDSNYFQRNGFEPKSMALLQHLLRTGDTFIDVGANVGIYSVAAAHLVGDQGRVIAFEPSKRNRSVLAMNLKRHRVDHIVDVRAAAVGESQEQRTFRVYENGLVSGFGEAPATSYPGSLLEEDQVSVTCLSTAVQGPVDIIKIDVEGFEIEVLRGAAELIERNSQVSLLIEFNPAALYAAKTSPDLLLDFLPEQHWDLWLIDEQSVEDSMELVRFDRTTWNQYCALQPGWYANLLATPTTNQRLNTFSLKELKQ